MKLSVKFAIPALIGLTLLSLAACDKTEKTSPPVSLPEAPKKSDISPTQATVASASALSIKAGQPAACAAEIGAAAAERRVKLCLSVSPATHPPCNVANSCAMIDNEIARSCALFDGKDAPMPGCQPAPKSQEAAIAVITRYYDALNARDYATAFQQWGDNGPPNQTLSTFTSGFAHTVSTEVTIGKPDPAEGAAGSIYQTIPVTVEARLDDGTRQRFTGDYIVRRVNGVDGASPSQLRWHIGSAHLAAAATD
ncbi:MAG: hypothetical protein WBQ60_11465 [Asticcacaulis sp.]